jgi:hypothetical protein
MTNTSRKHSAAAWLFWTCLLQVSILVPRRPVAGQHHLQHHVAPSGQLAKLKTVVAALYAFSHVSLTNVQLVCSKAAASTRGIVWVPGKLVQGKDGPVAPEFSATGCTIEGFQVRCGQNRTQAQHHLVECKRVCSFIVVTHRCSDLCMGFLREHGCSLGPSALP